MNHARQLGLANVSLHTHVIMNLESELGKCENRIQILTHFNRFEQELKYLTIIPPCALSPRPTYELHALLLDII